ncbi:autotransporter domain-containing protein [Pseudomonas sp. WS 5106]|uniref:Autotransporter domain-containing protein n=1 Tax=Pseudomonas cremoris TaxID=2724178 RepID=A0A7X1DWK3_9PSED|nr:autotransporter domain-containing protein [Pseudomonas cremoris]MBC2379941.1 autotransporter domain-containing protein [Pseudomonas cremoris]MBC2404454.1 autotransporter domain-containing protein [Pseudomonas cremoris]
MPVPPSHGDIPNVAGNGDGIVFYTNNGDGATSDTFTLRDDLAGDIIFTVTVLPANDAFTVTPSNVPAPLIGVPYSQSMSSTGGVAPYTYTYNPTKLPAGISVSTNGVISGTATATGVFVFAVTVTDSTAGAPLIVTKNYSVTVAHPTLAITPASLTAAGQSVAYSQQLSTSGGTAPYTYAVESGTLPPGLNLSPSGLLSGTPNNLGTYNFVVKSTDITGGGGPYSKTISYSIVVSAQPAPAIAGAVSAPITYGSTANPITLNLSGGAATSVAVASSAQHGTATASGTSITYTPTAGYGGQDSFTYTATNGAGTSAPATVTITVSAPTVTITPFTLPSTTVSTAYSQAITAANGFAPYTYAITSGSVPTGMNINATTGLLSGTPTAAGSFNFTVGATDSSTGSGPYSGAQAYTMTVSAPTISVAPTALPTMTTGVAYSQGIVATGGTTPYSYAITAGSVPTGLSLAPDGTLSGTPTAAGPYNFTVTATDSSTGTNAPFTGSRTYSGTVAAGAPVTGAVSAPVAYGSTANLINLNLSGGAATSVAVASPPQHGTATASGTSITYTPTTGYSGQDSFTYTATNGAGTSAPATVTITVGAPASQTITFANPGAQNFGTTPTLTATSDSGLTPTFTSSTTGVCTITSNGALTFITAGTCTINADQAGNGTYLSAPQVSHSFLVNAIVPGAPTSPVATAGNTSAQVSFTPPVVTGGAAITTYTVTSNPGGITATGASSPITVNGLTHGVAYSFTVTATNSAGTGPASSASSTVVPTANQIITFNNPGTQNFNTPPTLTATTDSGLPALFSSATPGVCSITPGGALTFITAGTCTINANQPGDSVYLPATQVSQSFTINAAGAVPLAPSQTLSAVPGQPIDIDLTTGATGGPFSAASVVSITPANAASAVISGSGNSYKLRFLANANIAGSVAVSYILSNAFGTSAAGVITFNVIARSDPSKDAEVQGLINAQANSSRRFASGQISNFQQRLEALHNGNVSSFSNGFNLTSNGLRRQRGHDEPDVMQQWQQVRNANDKDRDTLRAQATDDSTPALNNQPGSAPASPLAFWTAGTISVGNDARGSASQDQDFVTSGLSAGVDYRWSPQLTLGLGFGYGHDKTDIGDNGSRSEADSYSVAFYGSYRPLKDIYLDAVLGYQRLSFDTRRYITDNGGRAKGDRDGKQLFASLAAGYEYHKGLWLLNPYLRLDVADARLDSYKENGDSLYALYYSQQTVKTSSSSLGLRSQYAFTSTLGELTPSVRLEFQHDFQGAGDASMRYADFSGGQQYHAKLDALGQDRGLLGLGLGLRTTSNWSLRMEYQFTLSSGDQQAQSLLFNLEKPF